ncbi:hypothetical protein KJ590_02550 [Patescibacteria group bacterium]|nr:hypothetical protein [Patescibacteria group bacterium]
MASRKKLTNKIFLPHLYEPFRRKIAIRYAQHELRKLLPQLRGRSQWELIDKQVEQWDKNFSFQNFWNGIHGLSMGFALKSLVPWITSLNIKWEEKNVPIMELWFGGKFWTIGRLKNAESAAAVKEQVFQTENEGLLKKTKKLIKEKAVESAPRDDFPIFTVRKEGKLRVIDGNRRLLQAIVRGKSAIRAFVAEPVAEPSLHEHWVPTSLLVDLVFWHKHQFQIGRDTTKALANVIAKLILNSSAGRSEFLNRAVHHDDKIHMRLLRAVVKVLASYGVSVKIPK